MLFFGCLKKSDVSWFSRHFPMISPWFPVAMCFENPMVASSGVQGRIILQNPHLQFWTKILVAMAMLVGGAITILKHMWICMDSYMGIYIYGNIYGNMWVNMGISMGISGNWLVVQTHHLEKWWTTRQWLADDIPYMKWNIIQPCSKPPTSMAMSSLSIWEWWSPGDLRDRLTVLCGKTRTGWWLSRPSEKYESQLGWFLQIYGKLTNVPNHQPENGDFLEHLT